MKVKMGKPHIVAISYPGQGHVIPLMELVQRLANQGIKVTFVNTEITHKQVISALKMSDNTSDVIKLVSLPDGMEPEENRNEHAKLAQVIYKVMPAKLEELIEKINEKDDDKITCVLADECMGWALKVAEKMGIKRAAFWPASAAVLASIISIPKLIDDKIISKDGTILKKELIRLSPTMPAMNPSDFAWACIGDLESQKLFFDILSKAAEFVKVANWVLCNSCYELELEPGAFSLFPNIMPIGPCMSSNRIANQAGKFWPEDFTCLTWLDQQPPSSVIYVSFGSITVLDQTQFQELALGLELTNRPFLWVVRPDITMDTNEVYPLGFKDRTWKCRKIVGWAPQQKVLSHPSVACFLSHCGWNSTVEGVSNGLPFLCWPYFADQNLNQSYICDVWRTGLGFNKDKRGIVTQIEIKNKVESLFGDTALKARALDLKEKAMNSIKGGGRSNKNLGNFVEWINK